MSHHAVARTDHLGSAPTSLARIVDISCAVLLIFSGSLFALAEKGPIPALVVPVSLFAVLGIGRGRVRPLSLQVAGILGVAAFLFAAFEFFLGDIVARLLGLGHLITYLSCILMLTERQRWVYEWLLVLAVLQLAVAAVLTNSVWLGFSIIVYVPLLAWTSIVYCVYRSRAEVDQFVTLGKRVTAGSRPAESDVASHTRSSAYGDSEGRWVNPSLVGGTGVVSLLSLAALTLFFLLIPRVWIGSYRLLADDPVAGRRVTGFTQRVKLGDLGEILESREPLLAVRLSDVGRTSTDLMSLLVEPGVSEPLFRGAVLETYENGEWESRRTGRNAVPQFDQTLDSSRPILEVTLQPTQTQAVFTVPGTLTCVPADPNESLRFYSLTDVYRRGGDPDAAPFEYKLVLGERSARRPPYRMIRYLSTTLQRPVGLDRTRTLAVDVSLDTDKNLGEVPPRLRAERLVRHLRDSGLYGYTMNLSLDDPTVDPVEDFLFNRKAGHCEYFASALALMLRYVDVPSRLVSGSKGGTLDSDGREFHVQQLHAHAWVEAWIDGAWHTLDPTPAARDSTANSIAASHPALSLKARLSQFWNRGLTLSQNDQRTLIYNPIAERVSGAVARIRDARGTAVAVGDVLRELFRSPENWFSVRGGLVAAILGLLVSGLVWAVRRSVALIRRWQRTVRHDHDAGRSSLRLYERFARLAERHGLQRRAAQTQRDFAGDVSTQVRRDLEDATIAALPPRVSDLFYRVRFGGQRLDAGEASELERSIDGWERRLADRQSTRR